MPRIRQNEKIYREKDFLAELEKQKVLKGIRTDRELARLLGVSAPALCRRKQDLDSMTVADLRNFVVKLGMPAGTVMALVGLKPKKELP